jgi:prohibitin 1
VAQQQVETQRQVLAQREIEAQQKVATAKGEAESIQGVVQGQDKANDALSRSISPILVQYKSIEKWNGILPQVSGGAVPFFNLGKFEGLAVRNAWDRGQFGRSLSSRGGFGRGH